MPPAAQLVLDILTALKRRGCHHDVIHPTPERCEDHGKRAPSTVSPQRFHAPRVRMHVLSAQAHFQPRSTTDAPQWGLRLRVRPTAKPQTFEPVWGPKLRSASARLSARAGIGDPPCLRRGERHGRSYQTSAWRKKKAFAMFHCASRAPSAR